MHFFERIFINIFLFIAIAGLLPTMFHVSSIWIALIASVILAIFDLLLKPVISFLSLPITIITLGLFSIVINGVMLELTSFFINNFIDYNSFTFSNFTSTLIVAILLSIVNRVIVDYLSNVF